jgi:DNA polymerase-2
MQIYQPAPLNSGFLLTRQSLDRQGKICITLWLKTRDGPVKLEINDQQAIFFVEQKYIETVVLLLDKARIDVIEVKPLLLKTFNQVPVSGVYFNSLREFYSARDCLKQQNIKCYEDDFRPDERYLMERYITGDLEFIGTPTKRSTYTQYQQVRCKPLDKEQSKVKLAMVSLDIECSMAGDLYSIGLYSDTCRCVLMIGPQPPNTQLEDQEGGYIVWLNDEKELLTSLLAWVKKNDPDLIIGWNVINFDFDLLQKRYDLYKLKFSIGRDGSGPYWRKNRNSEQKYIDIAGRVVLDGIDLLKSATYSFPSFSLDNVANTLLGIGKKVDDVDNRLQEITDNFLHDKAALAAYNLEDCRLVWLIFEKTELLQFAMLRSQLTGLEINRIGGSVAAFTNLYLPKLHRSGYIAPNMGDGDSDLISPGGYVMDSIPGLYDNVLVLDFKSLYPSIIRTFNIDPMGLIEGLLELPQKDKEPIAGYDGAYFSRDKHFLPNIIKSLWHERDIAKKDKNAALSQAIKIIMNSFYGILGSTGCRFFDPRLAGSITKRSHALLKTTKQWIEAQGYQVIYGDTDSIFVHVGIDNTLAQSRALGQKLQDIINTKMDKMLADEFNVVSELEIEFETHFSKFLMPTIRGQDVSKGLNSIGTKKRYAGVVDGELVFKGLETVRSDWTDISKTFQQELYRLVFSNSPVDEYLKKMVSEIKSGIHDTKLIYMKKIRRNLEDYVNTPPHIKAAQMANAKLVKEGLKPKYRKGSKIEYVITMKGVQHIKAVTSSFDYDFYIDRQIKPIADDILPFIGKDFDTITSKQIGLF